jgi:hypothetical protein
MQSEVFVSWCHVCETKCESPFKVVTCKCCAVHERTWPAQTAGAK